MTPRGLSLLSLANKLKVLCGLLLDTPTRSPSNKELSKLIWKEVKSCGGWKFFSKSELKEGETIESHIILLNKEKNLSWQNHLNSINIYYHNTFPKVPYLIVKPRDYDNLKSLADKVYDLLDMSVDNSTEKPDKKLFHKNFSQLVNQTFKSYYGWKYFNLNDSIENVPDFVESNKII